MDCGTMESYLYYFVNVFEQEQFVSTSNTIYSEDMEGFVNDADKKEHIKMEVVFQKKNTRKMCKFYLGAIEKTIKNNHAYLYAHVMLLLLLYGLCILQ